MHEDILKAAALGAFIATFLIGYILIAKCFEASREVEETRIEQAK